MEMNRDIQQTLDYCKTLFAVPPQWLVLSTVRGEYVGHVILSEAHIEIERIVALSAGAAGHYERHAMEYRLGSAHYGLTLAEAGFVIYAFVGKERILCLLFKDATLTTLTAVLRDMPDVVEHLGSVDT